MILGDFNCEVGKGELSGSSLSAISSNTEDFFHWTFEKYWSLTHNLTSDVPYITGSTDEGGKSACGFIVELMEKSWTHNQLSILM